jgi:hypothetical protein
VFDLDLWRRGQPGLDETLDADRFGVWLDVLMESGAAVAAEKLMGVDADLMIAALAQHMRVFDRAAVARTGFEIGNYLVEPTRSASWDAIVALLLHLDAEQHDYFNRVMRGCRRLSNAGFEADGLHDLLGDAGQALFNLASGREQRRDKQGYVAPAQARAFLQTRSPSDQRIRHKPQVFHRWRFAVRLDRLLEERPDTLEPMRVAHGPCSGRGAVRACGVSAPTQKKDEASGSVL